MNEYKGLGKLLHLVRGAQNYAAVVAEGLILLAFAGSSLDVSIGGRLAGIGWLAVGWGIVFALGLDTSFILSWVRVRQAVLAKKYHYLWWSIPLAMGMSFIVFQPVAIQQLQQSMGISFNAALANLGIDLNILVYARSFVSVLLGAVLAMTNVETPKGDEKTKVVAKVTKVTAELPDQTAELPEKAESLTDKEAIVALMLANPGENLTKLAKEKGIPRTTLQYWRRTATKPAGILEEFAQDNTGLTRKALRDNPSITDEELARLIGINRPAAARFWRLKAEEVNNE